MLRVAGEVADGVCVNWLGASDIPRVVAVARGAAAAAGRDPASLEITARLMVCVDPPGEEQGVFSRRHIAGYLNVPVYRQFHQWLGRTALKGMWDAWDAGDRRTALAALSDETVDELIIRGTAEERRAHVQRYFDGGVDTAFLMMLSGAPDPAERQRRVLAAAPGRWASAQTMPGAVS
jgi:alkanesulfonate monooxygenase SsuD/methylene tetrahydromethanopterin reductase-like flavin-dependent oxidoreductase (luciferase family)